MLPTKYMGGFPKHEVGEPVHYFDPAELFTRRYATDAHYACYSVPELLDGYGLPRRLTVDLLRRPEHAGLVPDGGVRMAVVVFDVDFDPAHRAKRSGEPEVAATIGEWWSAEKVKVARLLAEHPGAFVYLGRGGYKVVYQTAFAIWNEADAERWSTTYVARIAYLFRCFGIVADPACADWTHLFRLPFVVRDGVTLDYETIGDPAMIDFFEPALAPEDVARFPELHRPKRSRTPTSTDPRITSPTSDGQGVLFWAFSARGWIGHEIEPSKWACQCPNEAAHTKGARFDSSTVLYAPREGDTFGWVYCSHGHCTDLAALPYFTREELEAAQAAAGVPSRLQPEHVADADFAEAQRLLNEDATDEEIVAQLRATSAGTFAAQDDADAYFARTARNARRVHEEHLVPTTIVHAYLTQYSHDASRPPCAVVTLTLATLDGEVLPQKAKLTAPSAGYEDDARRRREWVAIGEPDAERIAANDFRLLREWVVGRELLVALGDRRVARVFRRRGLRDETDAMLATLGDEVIASQCRAYLAESAGNVRSAHARLVEIVRERGIR